MLGGKKRFKSSKIILGCEHEEKKIHKLFFYKKCESIMALLNEGPILNLH